MALWLIQKLKKSDSLQQLQLKDNTTLKPPSLPYLYKLLRKPAFAYFKYCVLVSTAGDKYVPFHSSRIELSREADNDKSDFGKIHKDSIRQVERMILQWKSVLKFYHLFVHSFPNFDHFFLAKRKTRLIRYHLQHPNPGGTPNSTMIENSLTQFTGRAAHVMTLENECLMEKFFITGALRFFI